MKPNFYAIIPASVRYDKNLSSSEKLFYAELTAMSQKEGYCWASNSYFSELFGVSKNTITRWLMNLKSYGHVTVDIIREGKQITRREIYPINNNVDTYPQKRGGGTHKNDDTPTHKNGEENTTSNNTTSINRERVKKFAPPTLQKLNAYISTREIQIDAENFLDHYKSNGWMVGRNKMKDWKAAVRTWEKKEKSFAKKEKDNGRVNVTEWAEDARARVRALSHELNNQADS